MGPALSSVFVAVATATQAGNLAERVEALEHELELMKLRQEEPPLEETPAATTQVSLNAFNPSISIFGSGLFRFDRGAQKDSTFNVREVEADFRASVDPFADGVVIASFESEEVGEFEAGIEEGYIIIKRLPIPVLDDPPLGLSFKLGRFRTEIGRINRLHLHDLPHVERPLVVDALYGEEGFIGNGGSAHIFIPTPFETSSLELTAEVVSGGGVAIADSPSRYPGFIGNLRWFSVIAGEHNLDLSFIFHAGRAREEADLWGTVYSGDVLYKWKPLRAGEYQSFVLGGQFFYAKRGPARPYGYFAFAQVQATRALYLGARWDDTRLIEDPSVARRAVSGYLTLYASEFLRFRIGYEHRFRSDEPVLNSAFAELTFVLGAHPPEPFWVNK
jgi:hypothetical protein